jgi:hypothetical protein
MTLSAIESLYEQISSSIFTIEPIFTYPELSLKFVELSQAIINFDGDSEEWYYLGESNECQLDDMIIGAFWHYTNYHNGQDSDAYLALSSLGQIYQPNMEKPPSEDENATDEENTSIHSCFVLLNKMAEKCKG